MNFDLLKFLNLSNQSINNKIIQNPNYFYQISINHNNNNLFNKKLPIKLTQYHFLWSEPSVPAYLRSNFTLSAMISAKSYQNFGDQIIFSVYFYLALHGVVIDFTRSLLFYFVYILSFMTEIIDFISFSQNLNSKYPQKNSQQLQTLLTNFQSSLTPGLRKLDIKNMFLISGKSREYDLLIDLDHKDAYLVVRVFIFTKFGQILKIQSQTSRVQLIRHFSSQNSPYQPKINPLTGWVYFQFNFFYQKPHFNFQQSLRTPQLLKQIHFEKLFASIKKICPSETMSELEKAQKQSFSEGNLSQPIVKAVSGTFLNSDLQKVPVNSLKPVQNTVETFSKSFTQFHDFLQNSKYYSTSLSPFRIQKTLKDIESQQLSLNSLLKRKGGRSNYDTLLINMEAQKNLKELMMKMMEKKFSKQSIKIQEAELGKITLNLERLEQNYFQNKLGLLQSLPKMCEYHFIDKYYKSPLNAPILVSLSLKQQSLNQYLMNNASVMSLETKMRILLQIYSGVSVLWEESKLMYYVGNLKKVFVTKTLGVKLRGSNYFKPQKHVMLEDRNLVNQKLAQSLLNLTKLYFKVFHQQDPFYVKPTSNCLLQKSQFQYCRSNKVLEKVCMNRYLPDLMNDSNKRYISCLNYLFMEQMNVVRKIIQENQLMGRDLKREVWKFETSQQEEAKENTDENENKPFISTKMAACWLLSAYY